MDKLAESISAPEVIQVVSAESLKKNCDDKQLCVVSVLPHILECQSECRKAYLNILTELGDKYKRKMWGYVWQNKTILFL